MKETEEIKKLKKVPIEYLWEGLVLSDNIYNYNGTVLLIPQGEVLTKEKLERLSKFENVNGYITTCEKSYRTIMEGEATPPDIRQKMYEDYGGYTVLKKDVDQIFAMTRDASRINRLATESLIEGVFSKINEANSTHIFQCIGAPRKMDERLQRHSLSVAFFNGLMGQWLDLSEEQIKMLVCAGLVHDIGKTKIPEEILYAPRKLTEEEYEVMKQHPVFSYELLWEGVEEEIRQAVRHHHEKLDGSGYPDGISGEEISLLARITSITDVYDAMVSQRDYKASIIPFDVLEKLQNREFQGLDEELLTIFIKQMIAYYKEVRVMMSDGSIGVVKYVPPNDISHPVVQTEQEIKQTDEEWYCTRIVE